MNTNTPKLPTDPYQWFFPLGLLFGFLGTGTWILFGFGKLPFYPALPHAEAMIGGFLLTVAVGFLMTAIPRFTGTPSATLREKMIMLLVITALLVTFFSGSHRWFYTFLIVEILLLLRFGLMRLVKAAFKPPPSFPLVGLGLAMGLTGSFMLSLEGSVVLEPATILFARLIFFYGMFLGFALGIGTQLLPSIMGLIQTSGAPALPTPLNAPDPRNKKRLFFMACGAVLVFSFALEAWVDRTLGRLIRALLVSTVVLGFWKIYRRPHSPGILPLCLWISSWMLVLGVWPGVIAPGYAVHGAHILFVGSLSLMIFSVATRVTLSHGGHDLAPERRSKALIIMLAFLMVALILRLAAPSFTHYFPVLAVASMAWMLAALSWSALFVPKIIFKRD